MSFRSARSMVLSICLFTILFLVTVFWALIDSEWGTQKIITQVGHIDFLEVEYEGGTLASRLALKRLDVNLEPVRIRAENISVSLTLRCLLRKTLCIDTIQVQALNIELPDNVNDNSETEKELVAVPFAIRVNDGEVKELKLIQTNMHLAAKIINFSGNFGGSALNLKTLFANSVSLDFFNKQNSSGLTEAQNIDLETLIGEVYVPLHIFIVTFGLNELTLIVDATRVLSGNKISLSGSLGEHHLNIDQLNCDLAFYGETELNDLIVVAEPVMGSLAFLLSPPYTLTSSLDFSNIYFNNTRSITGLSMQVEGQDSKYDMELQVKGDIQGRVSGQFAPRDHWLYKLEGEFSADLDEFYTGLRIPEFRFSSSGNWDTQAVEVANLNLQDNDFGQLNVIGSVTHQDHEVHFRHWLIEHPATETQLSASGQYTPVTEQEVKLQGNLALNAKQFGVSNIETQLNLSLDRLLDDWRINSSLEIVRGTLLQQPIEGQLTLDWRSQNRARLALENLEWGSVLATFDTNINVQGVKNLNEIKSRPITGKIDIHSTDIRQMNEWLTGKIVFRSNLAGTIESPQLNIQLNGEGLQSKDPFGRIGARTLALTADLTLENNWEQLGLAVALEAENGFYENLNFDTLGLAVEGSDREFVSEGFTTGELSSRIRIDSLFALDGSHVNHRLEVAEMAYGDYRLKADQSIDVLQNWVEQTWKISSHCWLGRVSHWCLNENATLSPELGKLDLSFKFNLADYAVFIEEINQTEWTIEQYGDVKGLVNGDISMEWSSSDSLSLDTNILLGPGGFSHDKHTILPWQSGRIDIQFNDDELVFLSTLEDDQFSLNVEGAYDLNATVFKNSRLKVERYSLAAITGVFPELEHLEGLASTDLVFQGEIQQPNINGQFKVEQGRIKAKTSPVAVDQFTLKVDFDGEQAQVIGEAVQGKDSLFIDGNFHWQPELFATLALKSEGFSVVLPPEFNAKLQPDVVFTLRGDNLHVDGSVEVVDGELNIGKLSPNGIAVSNDVIIVDQQFNPIKEDARYYLTADLRTVIYPKFYVDAEGYKGNIGGEIQLRQQRNQPAQLFGNLQTVDGIYAAYGQRLVVERGVATFNGPFSNPHIDLFATRSIKQDNVKVGVMIDGMADALKLSIYSDPLLEQPDALSYLIRGRPLEDEAGSNSTGIGLALGMSLTNFSGVLNEIEKVSIVNNIKFDSEGDGDASQATVSGYIGNRLYIKYGVGVYEPIEELTLRLYLMNRLWIETVSGIESSGDIYYSFDIE